MLSQEERQRLEEIERRLLADDPRFVRRMRWPRLRLDVATVVLMILWLTVLVFAVATHSMVVLGALFAVLVIETGWRIYRHRHPIQPAHASPEF
jgi:hypothetical protein